MSFDEDCTIDLSVLHVMRTTEKLDASSRRRICSKISGGRSINIFGGGSVVSGSGFVGIEVTLILEKMDGKDE